MRVLSRLTGALVALAASAATAAADPIVANQWYTFGFGGAGSLGFHCPGCTPGDGSVYAPDAPWTYTSATAFSVTVLDGFNLIDQFSLLNGGSLVGSTSTPAGGSCGNDILACLADPSASKGVFALAPGSYSFDIRADLSPQGGGAAFFRVDAAVSAVPEPSTYILMATGLVAIAGFARRRKA